MKNIIAILAFCCLHVVAGAQDNVYPPKAILIKLNTKAAAISHLSQKGKTAKARLLQQDIDTFTTRLMRDWKDHFNYCPVYFFADSNLTDVLEGRYAKAVFDTAHRAITPEQIQAMGRHFYIAYMGVRSQDDYTAANATPGATQLPSLIVNDSKMKPLGSYKIGSSMNANPISFLFPRKSEKPYRFRSRYFNLDYFPVAEKYEQKLRKYWEQ